MSFLSLRLCMAASIDAPRSWQSSTSSFMLFSSAMSARFFSFSARFLSSAACFSASLARTFASSALCFSKAVFLRSACMSIFSMFSNSSPIFFSLTLSVSLSVSGTGTFIFSKNARSTFAMIFTRCSGESFRISSISLPGSWRKFTMSSAVCSLLIIITRLISSFFSISISLL